MWGRDEKWPPCCITLPTPDKLNSLCPKESQGTWYRGGSEMKRRADFLWPPQALDKHRGATSIYHHSLSKRLTWCLPTVTGCPSYLDVNNSLPQECAEFFKYRKLNVITNELKSPQVFHSLNSNKEILNIINTSHTTRLYYYFERDIKLLQTDTLPRPQYWLMAKPFLAAYTAYFKLECWIRLLWKCDFWKEKKERNVSPWSI